MASSWTHPDAEAAGSLLVRARAEAIAARLPQGSARIEAGTSVIGGGSTPDKSLPTWLLVMEKENASAEEKRLRANEPPVIARIENDRVVLDLRTVLPDEEEALVQALSW